MAIIEVAAEFLASRYFVINLGKNDPIFVGRWHCVATVRISIVRIVGDCHVGVLKPGTTCSVIETGVFQIVQLVQLSVP